MAGSPSTGSNKKRNRSLTPVATKKTAEETEVYMQIDEGSNIGPVVTAAPETQAAKSSVARNLHLEEAFSTPKKQRKEGTEATAGQQAGEEGVPRLERTSPRGNDGQDVQQYSPAPLINSTEDTLA
jgi:hypothetical protein